MALRTVLLCACAAVTSVPAAAQCPDGTPPPCARAGRTMASAPASVAVLYLENLSRDTADAYLADGLTEELTSRLGSIQRLRVTGRTAVRRAQQQGAGDLAAMGRALGVRYLVEGSVRRSGERVRVSVRLLRATDGVRVWGDDYDRTLTDLLALQEDVAREVAANVAGRLLPAERAAISVRPTTDAAAYMHYLRGSYLVTRRTSHALQQAAQEFEQAARRDPNFAAAEAGRARAYALAYAYGVEWAPAESLAAWSIRASERAIRLDSTSSDVWLARGAVQVHFARGGLRAARTSYERAVALDSRNAEAHHALGTALAWLGEDSAAAAALQRALALDPARGVTLNDLAQEREIGHRFDEARRLLDSAIAVDPRQFRPYLERALVRVSEGDVTGARLDAETGLRLSTPGSRGYAQSHVAWADVARGDTALARQRVAALERAGPSIDLARALLAIGERDSALAVLERAPPHPVAWYWLRFPEFDALRPLPRFQRIFDAIRP
jgi:TolB-like protein/Tfp pilus assembly protein PilF